MADNVTAPAAGAVFATDEIGGVHWPFSRLAFGPDGTSTRVADADGARLPVTIGGAVPLPTGAATQATLAAINDKTPALDGGAVPITVTNNHIQVAQHGTWSIGLDAPTLAALETVSIAGTVSVAAASLPLPTGAATETTVAALNAKFAALESGRAPVAVQSVATTTRAYAYADGQRLTTSGTGQVRSTAVAATEILVHASVRGFIRVGDNAVAATVGAGSIPLAADEKFHLRITSGQFVSFIRDGASDGSLTIMPVA